MMDDAPERIWTIEEGDMSGNRYGMWDTEKDGQPTEAEYVRADLYDAANQNEADAIAAYGDLMIKFAALERENERLRMQATVMDDWLAGEPSEPPRTGLDKTPVAGHVYTPWGYAK